MSLTSATAATDEQYQDLGDAVETSHHARAKYSDPEHEEVTGNIAEARRRCDDL